MCFADQKKMKAVTFSFDDGTTQDIRMVELLNKYGLKATFNLNSGLLGQSDILTRPNGDRISHYKLSPKDVADIYAGHEVAAHTLTHPRLTYLEDKDVICQVEGDRQALSELVGYEVVGMAYPYGATGAEHVAKLIKEQTEIRYCRTIQNTDSFDRQTDLYRFDPNCRFREWDRMWELGRRFVELQTDVPQIFYIWGHTYEMDFDSDNWVKMEEFLRFICDRDDIFYGTNAEVLL